MSNNTTAVKIKPALRRPTISIRDMRSTSVRYQITKPRIDVKPAEA
jgi:hypothetical protein